MELPAGFVNEVVVAGLERPNSLAFLPDGRVLFTEERTGRVRMVVGGHIAATDPLLVVPDVEPVGMERGLQGVAVDPGWPARPFVYLFHNRVGGALRVVRYTASGDLGVPAGESIALDAPLVLLDDLPDASQFHSGGCLRFGSSGHLFVSLGDDEEYCAARDSTSRRGQILRLRIDGLPPGPGQADRAAITPFDNPLSTPDSNARLVWAYGLRNPWRFHVDPENGLLYVADPGDASFEEYDEVRPGDRLGWPYREGNQVIARVLCPEPGGAGANPYVPPIATYPHPQSSTAINAAGPYRPAGGASDWPIEYHGSLFYGDYYQGFLRRLAFDGDSWEPAAAVPGQPSATDWAIGLLRAVDFLVGPDGSLWWLSQFDETFGPATGSLQRIRWAGPLAVDAPPRGGRALSAAPVPFVSGTELTLKLAGPAHVRLAIHDAAGRRVRLLMDEWSPAGERRLAWDGRDDRGAPVAAGLYLARLERPEGVETLRIPRLR